jgi:hypothetical protein
MTGSVNWKYETEGSELQIESPVPPVAHDDHLYVLLTTQYNQIAWSKGFILCLDRNSGALHWKYEIKGYLGEHSSPVISENRLYSNGVVDETTGAVFCLDIDTGELKWQFENIDSESMRRHSGWENTTHSVISGNYVYCSGILGEQGYIFSLDKFTGELKKKLQAGRQIPFDPILTDGKAYVATRDGILLSYRQGSPIFHILLAILVAIPIVLFLPFGLLGDQMHRWMERRSGRPTAHEERRYQNRFRKVGQILGIAHGLARALSGGSDSIIVNIYWGWLIIFYGLLSPIVLFYYFIILIPLDPWFPKWWPYAVYFLYVFLVAMISLI